MKRFFLYVFVVTGAVFQSCKKDPAQVTVALTVQLQLAGDLEGVSLDLSGTEVKISNELNGASSAVRANAAGMAQFSNVTPGVYTVNAEVTISPDVYTQATGIPVDEPVVVNGGVASRAVNESEREMVLTLRPGNSGALVIKQVYYAGSDTRDGAVYRDQFIEIYNNSDQLMYADSLYIATARGSNTANPNTANRGYNADKSYDWRQSEGMNNERANDDYFYANTLYMIPGTGTTYPIQPGRSIIIAQNALNHKVPYVNAGGQSVSVNNPDLTIDLSGADFEVFYGDVPGVNPLATDVDNPGKPNVKVIETGGIRDMILNNNGHLAVVIFKTATDISTYPSYPDPTVAEVQPSTSLWKQIPISSVMDAVDIRHTNPASRAAKRLSSSIDAGFTFNPSGNYTSESVIRKTARTTNTGRIILQDTNNSTVDFNYHQKADPTKAASSFGGLAIPGL